MIANRRASRRAAFGLVALLAGSLPLAAQQGSPLPRPADLSVAVVTPAEADLFALPRIAEETRSALALIASGDVSGAAALLDRLIQRHPDLGRLRVTRAAAAMLAGDADLALAGLETAAARGTPDLASMLADPVFAPLAADRALAPRFAALGTARPPRRAPAAMPETVAGGSALVSGRNTRWESVTERLVSIFAMPDHASEGVTPAEPRSAARDLLREHWRRGRAAGNHGDLYDNRDRGHSRLDDRAFPQLTQVVYSAAARAAGADYGLNDSLLFDRVTIGNSSTAITEGPHWRSLPRHALTRRDGTGPMRLWQNAAANHLYVYPAHRDYGGEAGDLFPANTPYVLVSRGSSGSDQPFLEAAAMILAAFRPATKARLVEERLVVPTVQMVFRRSLQHVQSRAAYFSGAAHPAAFEGYQINLARMVSLAQSIEPDAIPAEVRLQVLEEDLGREGIDYFGQGLTETLFDTPQAIARIWRSKVWRRTMLVSAEASRDPNGRPLSFHWHLLQGDPSRVTIEPLADGRRARITIDWHEPFAISADNDQITARVDVGVFVHNGIHDSAPAILSWHFPAHESRTYEPAPGGGMRIAAIDYAAPARAGTYADPLLYPQAIWRDDYRYDATGRLAGWTRHRGGRAEAFTAEGARLLDAGRQGRPGRAEAVEYRLSRTAGGTVEVEELSTGRLVDYAPATGAPRS
jgi:hypothetical protein